MARSASKPDRSNNPIVVTKCGLLILRCRPVYGGGTDPSENNRNYFHLSSPYHYCNSPKSNRIMPMRSESTNTIKFFSIAKYNPHVGSNVIRDN